MNLQRGDAVINQIAVGIVAPSSFTALFHGFSLHPRDLSTKSKKPHCPSLRLSPRSFLAGRESGIGAIGNHLTNRAPEGLRGFEPLHLCHASGFAGGI